MRDPVLEVEDSKIPKCRLPELQVVRADRVGKYVISNEVINAYSFFGRRRKVRDRTLSRLQMVTRSENRTSILDGKTRVDELLATMQEDDPETLCRLYHYAKIPAKRTLVIGKGIGLIQRLIKAIRGSWPMTIEEDFSMAPLAAEIAMGPVIYQSVETHEGGPYDLIFLGLPQSELPGGLVAANQQIRRVRHLLAPYGSVVHYGYKRLVDEYQMQCQNMVEAARSSKPLEVFTIQDRPFIEWARQPAQRRRVLGPRPDFKLINAWARKQARNF